MTSHVKIRWIEFSGDAALESHAVRPPRVDLVVVSKMRADSGTSRAMQRVQRSGYSFGLNVRFRAVRDCGFRKF